MAKKTPKPNKSAATKNSEIELEPKEEIEQKRINAKKAQRKRSTQKTHPVPSFSSSSNSSTPTFFNKVLKFSYQLLLCSILYGSILTNLYHSLKGLWEQDIWWQIKAGEEVLTQLRIQRKDEWSYTAYGAEWYNVWWISTIILYLIHKFFQVRGLVFFRAVLALVFNLGILEYRLWNVSAQQVFVCTISMWLCHFRIQVRPETMVFCFWSLLLGYLRCSNEAYDENNRQVRKELILCFGLFMTSNMHFGLIVFGYVIAGSLIAGEYGPFCKKTWMWAPVVLLSGLIMCPYTMYGIEYIRYHSIGYNTDKVLSNPDMVGLLQESTEYLPFYYKIFAGICTVLVLIPFPAKTYKLYQNFHIPIPYGYSFQKMIVLPTHLLFIYLVYERSRVIPFHVLYMVPILVFQLQHLCFIIRCIVPLDSITPLLLTTSISISFYYHKRIASSNYKPRFDISTSVLWPIHSTDFIREYQPSENIYHTFDFGNYLLYHLNKEDLSKKRKKKKQYKVFGDTRETIFRSLEVLYRNAYDSPVALQQILASYNIHTICTKIPNTALDGYYYVDIIENFNPSKHWAVVYFDDLSIVVINRSTKQNQELIKKHEYKLLKPNLPIDHFLQFDIRRYDKNYMQLYKKELDYCFHNEFALRENFVPVFCELAKIAFDHYMDNQNSNLSLIERRNRAQDHLNQLSLISNRDSSAWKMIWVQGMKQQYFSILNEFNNPDSILNTESTATSINGNTKSRVSSGNSRTSDSYGSRSSSRGSSSINSYGENDNQQQRVYYDDLRDEF